MKSRRTLHDHFFDAGCDVQYRTLDATAMTPSKCTDRKPQLPLTAAVRRVAMSFRKTSNPCWPLIWMPRRRQISLEQGREDERRTLHSSIAARPSSASIFVRGSDDPSPVMATTASTGQSTARSPRQDAGRGKRTVAAREAQLGLELAHLAGGRDAVHPERAGQHTPPRPSRVGPYSGIETSLRSR